ncbi:MAG: sigma factor-like helix-turn-helix DNA-binding protein [Nitrososphaerales archaeon]
MSADDDIQKHRILREVFRHYLTFEALCEQTGRWEIEHKGIRINFLDLQGALKKLSKRKKEAVLYNVILDKKQKDVAKIMGITTVSVGQYVDQAMLQISKELWG